MDDRNKSGQQDDMQKKPSQGQPGQQQGQRPGQQQGQQEGQGDQGQRDREKKPA